MSRSKYWLFTLNNPTVEGPDFLESAKAFADLTFILFQLETGEQGTPHFQGYVEFSERKRLPTLRALIPGAHWESRKGTQQQSITYCSKEDTRTAGPWSHGEATQTSQGARTDLTEAVATLRSGGLKRVREEHPEVFVKFHRGLTALAHSDLPTVRDPPEVHLFFGPAGCGKTRSFYDRFAATGRSIPCSDGFWFDGYEGHTEVLLDDFDGRASKWSLQRCLQVLDRYPLYVPVKGGFTPWVPRIIYITSNFHPSDWYDWTSRRQQYASLCRRFTQVHWWKQAEGEPTLIDAGDPEAWKHFWDDFCDKGIGNYFDW